MIAKPLALFAVLILGSALSACSSTSPPGAGDLALQAIRERVSAVDAIYLSDSIIGALPNQTYRLDDGRFVAESDEVIVGSIANVEVSTAYKMDGERVTKLDDPLDETAWWRMLTISITVERYWGPNPPAEASWTLPVSNPAPVQDTIESLKSLGTVLLIMKDGRIVHNEEYLGVVTAEGTIEFPVLENSAAAIGISTVDQLWRQLGSTPEVRDADLLGLR